MPFELTTPIQKVAPTIKVTKLELDFENSVAYLSYSLVYEDGTEQAKPTVLFEDWSEPDEEQVIFHPDFTNFYASYTTHAYLYSQIALKEGFSGTYDPEGEPQ